jgi:hypothetical protein
MFISLLSFSSDEVLVQMELTQDIVRDLRKGFRITMAEYGHPEEEVEYPTYLSSYFRFLIYILFLLLVRGKYFQ